MILKRPSIEFVLIFKLSELNIPDYLGGWFKNYLYEGTIQIKVNDILSSKKLIRAGVPQGSILGQFLLYFYSIVDQVLLNKYTNLALFADDLAIWLCSQFIKTIDKEL